MLKSSPSETVDRLAQAAIEKCDCLVVRSANLFPRRQEDLHVVPHKRMNLPNLSPAVNAAINAAGDAKDAAMNAALVEGANAGAIRGARDDAKRSVAHYILDMRAGANLGNPPRAWTAVEQMISSCPAGSGNEVHDRGDR